MIGNLNQTQSFGDTLRYVLRRRGAELIHNNVSVSWDSQPDYKAIAATMRSTAALNYRTSKPCFHLSLSPSSEDELKIEDWEDLTLDLLEEMGWGANQAVAVLHTDEEFPSGKPRPHVHIVGNLIDDEGNRANTDFSKYRLQEAIRKLERDYNLTPTASSWQVDRRRDTPYQVHRQEKEQWEFEKGDRKQPPQPTVRRQIQDALDIASSEATNFNQLDEILHHEGIFAQPTPHGWKLEKDGVWFGGYQLGKRYTQTAMDKQLQQNLTNNVVSQAGEGHQSSLTDEPDKAAQSPNVTNNVVSQEQEKEQLARQYQYYRQSLTDEQQSLSFLERDRAIAQMLLEDGYESEDTAIIVAQSPDIQKHSNYPTRLALTRKVVNSAVERRNQQIRRRRNSKPFKRTPHQELSVE
ncbi:MULTISPECIES: relaxase/mobilization nuclease domain-containing protein [unclassified Coleofasciculus]|uniref:relaxase/mobilization nuclease domain-containing protein n=1 Tax=unclassified Coleofasciculus TaxID=2692782 RepID=UPI0018803CF3|nr:MULTISPECIES: relaxase/mobilization nuclease domain-containing protein [unclassified Coleofasciculus]MBE9124763.1 relaxase/mobilization nuclease domain-containing protein [Coleofasciculus sp. LEGE 07081]MBE9148215.1 relaxase/mobilization nuclease domain-containing protein [Coleofasciculus sp. LEGE 07092]